MPGRLLLKPGMLWLLSLCGPRLAEARLGMTVDLGSSNFKDFIQSNYRVMVDFYDPGDPKWQIDSSELQTAVRMGREFGSKVPIGKVDVKAQSELAKEYVPNGPYPQLLWFTSGSPTQYHRTLRQSKDILDYVLALDRDPIQTFTSEKEVKEAVNRAIWAQIPKDSEHYKALEVVAAKHMDTVEVAFMQSPKTEIRWLEDNREEAPYEGKADVDALDRWVRDRLTISEPLPEQQEGDSLAVVARSFEDLVLQKDKDVFLLIYAPWCGFCKKVVPAWEAFARQMRDVPHLKVAKMDGDRNSSPFPEDFAWAAFPTIFYVRAGERAPLIFHGNRTVADFTVFAREHGSKDLLDDLRNRKEAKRPEEPEEL